MDLLESIIHTSDNGVDVSKKYLLTSYKYTKLKIFYLLTSSLATFIKVFLMGSLIATGFIFAAIAGAIALGEYFNNAAYGYLIVGGGMLLIGLLSLLFRKIIDRKVIKTTSKNFF